MPRCTAIRVVHCPARLWTFEPTGVTSSGNVERCVSSETHCPACDEVETGSSCPQHVNDLSPKFIAAMYS